MIFQVQKKDTITAVFALKVGKITFAGVGGIRSRVRLFLSDSPSTKSESQ